MNRSDMVNKVSELYPKLSRKDADALVKAVFNSMANHVATGKRIEIRGFGCFSLKSRRPGLIRNPRAGVSIASAERHVVYFRAGKELKNRVDS